MRTVFAAPDDALTILASTHHSARELGITGSAGVSYATIKNAILKKHYECEVIFVGEQRARRLNREYRGKDKPADVLSFPLDDDVGQIFICPAVAARHAHHFDRSVPGFYAFLFIHGAFHLKGMEHGSKMELNEARIRRRFSV